jgi:hypothetical protein
MSYFRNPRKIRYTKPFTGEDTFCYDCKLDTQFLECGPESGCFLSKVNFDKLRK